VPGRVEIDDVAPVVSCGAYPAKAVIDEVIPVRASVWREGHDAVAATLVVRYLGPRYPQLGETRRLRAVQAPAAAEPAADPLVRVKPLHVPMSMGEEPYIFHGAFTPDSIGLWTFRVDGWGDPIHTWRHAIVAKLDAGQGESELSNDLLMGAQLLERAATGVPRGQRDPAIRFYALRRRWPPRSTNY
jgi:starch synthase (maltosyl-transferring)